MKLNTNGIFFENFKTGNSAAGSFTDIDWQLVAAILNMFGRVENNNGNDTNLLPWKESFTDGELTGEMLQTGNIWSSSSSGNDFNQPLGPDGQSQPLYLKHNNLIWKYEAKDSGKDITLTASTANLYRAGYTGNKKNQTIF